MITLPLYILIGTTLLLHLREQWQGFQISSVAITFAGLFASLLALAAIGFGGDFQDRYIVDRFAVTIMLCAMGGLLLLMLLRPSLRSGVKADDLLAVVGIVGAAGAQDILLCFAGLAVAIIALTRQSRLSHASRLFTPPVIALALIAVGLAIIISLAGTSRIVDARISLGVTQVNHRGDIGMILIPALIALTGALALLLVPPPVDQWLARSVRTATLADPLLLLLWPLIVLVFFARFFIGMLFVFSDPVMSPNDWGMVLIAVLGIAMVLVMLAVRKERKQANFLFRCWQFQLLSVPLGLLAVTGDGLASSLALVVIMSLNTVLLSLLEPARGNAFTWPALVVAAAMIGFPGVAGFVARLATLDAVAIPHGLSFWLPTLLAVHFAVLALFCTVLVRHVTALISARRSKVTDSVVIANNSFVTPASPLVLALLLVVLVASSFATPQLITMLTPVGDLFGLTVR